MLRRKRADKKTALLAGVVAGLAGQAATATDVVVAYGDDKARQARSLEAAFQAQMDENARTITRAIKANVEREVMRISLPEIRRLAISDVPTRG